MADRYWVGATGTWNTSSTGVWSATSGGAGGASVPTAADNVIFDQTATVTMTGALTCLDITVTAGTVTFTSTGTLTVSGSMSLLAGTLWNNTGLITFNSTTIGKTITTNAVTINSSITLNGTGGAWSLGSALTQPQTASVTLTAGALDLNGFNISTGAFNSNNTNTRSIAFGSTGITLYGASNPGTALSMANATNFTWTGTGKFTSTMSVARTFTFGTTGGTSTNAPNLELILDSVPTLTTGSWFNKLDFGSTASNPGTTALNLNSLTLSSGSGTYTNMSVTMRGTGTITPNGKGLAALTINHTGTTTLAGALGCTTYTQTSGTIDFATFNLTCSGAASYTAGTLTNTGTISCTTFTNNGAFTFDNGTITPSSSFVNSSSGSFTYNSPAVLSAVATFTHTSGTVTLGKNYALTATGTYTLTAGTLNLSSNTLTTGIFASNSTSTRNIVFGTGFISLAHTTAAQTVLSMATLTGYSWTGTGGFTSIMSVTRIFTFGTTGGTSSNAINLFITGGASVPTLTVGSYFNILDFTGSTCAPAGTLFNVNTLVLASGGIYNTIGFAPQFNVTQTWTPQFSKSLGGFGVTNNATVTLGGTQNFIMGSVTTLTSGTLDLGGFDFEAKTFSSTNTNTRSIVFGSNNIILNTTTASTTILSMATATGFTWTGTGGFTNDGSAGSGYDVARTFVFGTTGGTAVNAPNLSIFSGSTGAVTITNSSWFNNLNFTGSSCTVTGTLINASTVTLATGGTYTGFGPLLTSTQTWTPQFSKQLGGFGVNGSGITVTMGGAQSLIATATTTLTAGTLDLGGFDLTTGIFSSTNTNTRSIAFGTNNIILAHTTLGTTVLSCTIATGFTYTGTGGFTTVMSVTRTFVFGTTGGSSTNAPNFSITSGASIPTFTTNSWFNTLNFTGSTCVPASTVVNINNLTLASGGTYTSLGVAMVGTGTITPTGKTISALTINHTGTTTLAAALGCLNYVQTSGTIDFATFNLTCSSTAFYSTGTLNNIGTITCTIWTVDTGTFTLTSGTITPSTSFIVQSAGTFNYNGGTLSAVPTFSHNAGTVSFGKAYSLTTIGTYTLAGGSLTLNGFDLTTGAFASTGATTRSIAFGTNNIILNYVNTGQTVLSFATATGFTCTGTGGFTAAANITRTYVFGTTGGSSTNAPNLTLTGSGTAIQTFTTNSWFNKLDFGTTAFTIGLSQLLNLNALTLSSGGTFTNLTATMRGTGTITSNGNTSLGLLTINSPGGTVTLAANLSVQNQTTLTAGTFNLNNFNLTCVGAAFNSNNANTRAIQFGTGFIILTASGVAVLEMTNATGFTWTGTGGFSSNATQNRTFTFGTTGGTSTNAPNLSLTSGVNSPTITTGSWFNILNFTGCTGAFSGSLNLNSLILDIGGTYTGITATMRGTGTITSNGKSLAALTINSTSGTTTLSDALTLAATITATLTSGTLALNGFNLTTGIFASTGTAARAIAFGSNNILLAHTTAATTVLSFATATGFTYTGTGGFTAAADITRTYVFGTTGGTATNSPNLSLTGSGTAVQTFTTGSYFNTLSFGTTSFNPGTTALNLNGLTLSSGGTFTTLTPTMVGTGTITSNSNTSLATLIINSTSGTTTLGAAFTLTATGTTTLTTGTLDLNGFDLTTGTVSSTNSNTRAIYFGSNNIILSHTTAATTVLSMANTTGFTYTGTGGFTAAADITRTYTCGTTSVVSGSVRFTGASQYLSIPANTALNFISADLNFTVECWIYPISFGTNYGTFMSVGLTGVTGANSYLWHLSGGNTGSVTFSIDNTAGGTFSFTTPTGTLTLNAWNHVAVTKNSGTINIWVNGVSEATGSQNSANTNTGRLGYIATGSGGAGQQYQNCYISNVRWVKGIAVYTGTFTPPTSPLTEVQPAGTNISAITGTETVLLLNTPNNASFLADSSTYNFTVTNNGTATSNASTPITVLPAFTPPNLSLTGSGTAVQTFTTGGYFNELDFGTTAFNPGTTALYLNSLTLSSSGTFTTLTPTMRGTGILTTNAKSLPSVTIDSTLGTTSLGDELTLPQTGAVTLTSGILALNGFNITTGAFNSNNSNTRSIAFGALSISLYGTSNPGTALSMADATNFTWTGTGKFSSIMSVARTFTFGTTGGTSTNAPNLELILDSVPTLTTGSWFNKLDFGSSASNPGTTALNLNALTLSSGSGTYTNMSATMRGTGIITPNGKTLSALTINSTGTATLAGALTVSGATTSTQGTLDLATYNLTSATFASTGSLTRSITGTSSIYTITGSGATAWSNASATGWSCSGITIRMTSASAKTFAGGGATYPILSQGGTGALTITGSNSFDDIQTTTRPSTITFPAATTTTVSEFTLTGTAGNLVTINSVTPGTQFTLYRLTGTTNASYLSIQDSNATGGAVWNAGEGSVNVSNNSGWIFTTPPSTGAGNFFAFF